MTKPAWWSTATKGLGIGYPCSLIASLVPVPAVNLFSLPPVRPPALSTAFIPKAISRHRHPRRPHTRPHRHHCRTHLGDLVADAGKLPEGRAGAGCAAGFGLDHRDVVVVRRFRAHEFAGELTNDDAKREVLSEVPVEDWAEVVEGVLRTDQQLCCKVAAGRI